MKAFADFILFKCSRNQETIKMQDYHTFKTLKSTIKFPFEPYGVQKVMMNTIIRTLQNKQHSLIESPTGTGKTLVLLCAALAWQNKSKELGQPFISDALRKKNADERIQKLKKRPCNCGRRTVSSEMEELKENMKKGKGSCKEGFEGEKGSLQEEEDDLKATCKRVKLEDDASLTKSPYFKPKKESNTDFIIIDDDDNDDCQIISAETEQKQEEKKQSKSIPEDLKEATSNDPNRKVNLNLCLSCAALEAEKTFRAMDENVERDGDGASDEDGDTGDAGFTTKVKGGIPRIYYGTRTHKQITQVIRELNKTPYKDSLKMCILSSRDRTCANDDVKDMPNRNDLCQDLIKAKGKESCQYFGSSDTNTRIFETINDEFDSKAWDIEDAYKFGKNHKCCPYYGTRSLQMGAEITFSPYNYLLDPSIRQAMDINLSKSIIIFDEAHNIEDICRETASFVIDTKQIDDIIEIINISSNHFLQGSDIRNAYQFFKDKLLVLKGSLMRFEFQEHSNPYGDREQRKVLTQFEMATYLVEVGLGPDCLSKFKENLNFLKGDDEEGKSQSNSGDEQQPAMSFNQLQFINQLYITLGFMYANNSKYKDDFRAVATRQLESDYLRFNSRSNHRQQQAATSNTYVWQLSLLCMNPGIAFEKITSLAWSIIVASGTLAPVESLKTELGCKFENVFEGKHVISSERIYASVLSSGPNRVELNCSFTNSLKLEFQDEVGYIVRDVCKTVPNGILCFFPSYERMENFYQRWFAKGLMMEIEKVGKKKLFREKKNSTVAEFETELENYNRHAKGKGAILFAVFRGKVSEGIDFADEAARAVLTIGIPYPNVKEITVDLKKNYNDVARAQKTNLMSGGDWYSSQAFRALNQALGRCLRHKSDWGAIILIDSRLQWKNTLNSISKWLRSELRDSTHYSTVNKSLEEFVRIRSNEKG